MKKYLGYLFLLLFFYQTIFSMNKENIIELKGKDSPKKMRIGVHKLKTLELSLDFNFHKNIILGEIPNYNNELIFISENLENIPSLKTVNGKRIINRIKRLKSNEPVKEINMTYEVIKNSKEQKTYIKIIPKTSIENVFIYLLDNKNYNIKKVYRGKFRKLLEPNNKCKDFVQGKVIFDPNRNAAIKLGNYVIQGAPLKIKGPNGHYADYAQITSSDYPKKIYPLDGTHVESDFAKDWPFNWDLYYIRIYVGKPGPNTPYYTTKVKSFLSGIFECSVNAGPNNGKIKFYTTFFDKYINFELKEWHGTTDQLFTIEYRRDDSKNWDKEVIHRSEIIIKTPPRTIKKTIDIKVKSPIVQYNHKNKFGIIESDVKGVKIYGENGQEFIKNSPWIEISNPVEYWGKDLGEHYISISDGSKIVHIKSLSNGGLPHDYIAHFSEADIMLSYAGGNTKSTLLGVHRHNFKRMLNKNIVVKHYYPGNDQGKEPAYEFTYQISMEKFDGRKYYDNNLSSIKLISPTKINYKPNSEGKINLGTIFLKNLDIGITKQSGGNGIRIIGVQDVFLKKIDDSNYPLIPGKLYFKNNYNSKGQRENILEGKNEITTTDEVYIILDKIAEGKLSVGGVFDVIDRTGKSPLKIGTTVHDDNITYYHNLGKLQIETDNRYIETTISISNPNFPIERKNGWILFNSSQYSEGKVSGYPEIIWGKVINPIDIPSEANLEIFTNDWKSLGKNTITKLPLKPGGTINLAYKKGNKFLALGYEKGEFNLNGAKDTYYLKFTEDNGNLIFTKKLNISYEKPLSISHSTTVEFLNPLTSHGKIQKGVVYFNGSNWSQGQTVGPSNSEILDYNGNLTKWFNIYGGIDYNLEKEDLIHIYDKNGKLYGILNNFTKKPLKIGNKNGKEIFYLYYDEKNKALGTGFNGSIYDGNDITETFYLKIIRKNPQNKLKKSSSEDILHELILKLPQFDPNVYFGFRNSDILENSSGIGKVGIGKERLETNITKNCTIDLKTQISTLGYYLEFLNEMPLGNENGIYGKILGKVKISSNIEGDPSLEGNIFFKSSIGLSPEIVALNKKQNTYNIYLHLEPSEYKKLLPNRHYKIVDSENDKNILSIGLIKNGNFLNKPLSTKLKLNTNLSFITLPSFIEIYPQNLNFGKFNIYSGIKSKESSANIVINGNNIKDFKVEIIEAKNNINIYKEKDDGTLDKNNFINVNNLRIEKIAEKITKINRNFKNSPINRIYKLFGRANFNPNDNLPIGTYSNNLMIEVTIID